MNEKIADEITEQIMNDPELKSHFNLLNEIYAQYEEEGPNGTLLIRGAYSEHDNSRFKLIMLVFVGNEEIHVPNIYLTDSMRGKGLGMKILSSVYDIAKKNKRHLFITDMTNSFFNKMRRKGARSIDSDTIMITDKTNLNRVAS